MAIYWCISAKPPGVCSHGPIQESFQWSMWTSPWIKIKEARLLLVSWSYRLIRRRPRLLREFSSEFLPCEGPSSPRASCKRRYLIRCFGFHLWKSVFVSEQGFVQGKNAMRSQTSAKISRKPHCTVPVLSVVQTLCRAATLVQFTFSPFPCPITRAWGLVFCILRATIYTEVFFIVLSR